LTGNNTGRKTEKSFGWKPSRPTQLPSSKRWKGLLDEIPRNGALYGGFIACVGANNVRVLDRFEKRFLAKTMTVAIEIKPKIARWINMERDFRYLRDSHGDAGARDIFEKICAQLLAAIFSSDSHPIKTFPGDEGIDILVGDFSKPIEDYQCKYFLDGIGDSQKKQIRESFKTAVDSKTYQMKKWILCVPCILTIEEFKWWSNWRSKNQEQHQITIELWDGEYLLSELKARSIYDNLFDNDIKLRLDEIYTALLEIKQRVCDEIIVFIKDPSQLGYQEAIFVKKLECAQIREIDGCKRDFFNAELSEHAILSKRNDASIRMLQNLKFKVFSLWQDAYRLEQDAADGNALLGRIYDRILDLDTTTLNIPLHEMNIFAKKGILHQWAEDCSIGWLSDYRIKLEQYLQGEVNPH